MAEKKEKQYVIDNPQLMEEWNSEKNIDISPSEVTLGKGKKIWWKCSKGHEWMAVVASRNAGSGCPYCTGRKVLEGYNDLQTVNPLLAEEWNYEKNIGLTPKNVMPNSDKKAWWKCRKGHEWKATIGSRNAGCGCPYCAGQKVLEGYNDLQTKNPLLSKSWDYKKNGKLMPTDVMPNSHKIVWWKCNEGHGWQDSIAHRNSGRSCPYCTGKRIIKGENDLQTINPRLASEWNYVRNGNSKPEDFMPNSNKKVWWVCSKGHEWQASIAHRNNGRGCPLCKAEQKTSFPEFAIVYYLRKYGIDAIHTYRGNGYELDVYIPSMKIAIEYDGFIWHQNSTKRDLTKNRLCVNDGIKLFRIREGLKPLNEGSVDYIVDRYQEDLETVLKRALSEITRIDIDLDLRRDTIDIENMREYAEKDKSVLFANPELAKEWNFEKNRKLKPEQMLPNSNKRVWWRCGKGHEWQASINHRNRGRGCPYCSGNKVLEGYNDLRTVNPLLAEEWNQEKNRELKPENFKANSGKKVWWKCRNEHEWQARIADRNRGGSRCPYCAGKMR